MSIFEQGNQWILIAKSLEGRTVTQVKNRYYSTKRRQERSMNNSRVQVKNKRNQDESYDLEDEGNSIDPFEESCQTLKLKLLFAQKSLLEHIEDRARQIGMQVCAGYTGISLTPAT
jgi:hypothetical protein